MDVAQQWLNSKGLTLCPCIKCRNKRWLSIEVIRSHLISAGIDSSYTRWVYHGEEEQLDEDYDENFNNEDVDGLEAGLNDASNNQFFDIGPTGDLNENEQSASEHRNYEKLYEAVHDPLYEGCGESALTFVVDLMNIKVLNKWSDKSFDMLLKLLRKVFPLGNKCPTSYYNTRKLLCEVGIGYQTIDACRYDCAIFYGEHKDSTICPVCLSLTVFRSLSNYVATRKWLV